MRGIKLDEILPPCPKCLERSMAEQDKLTIRGCPVPHPRRRGYFECPTCSAVFTKKESVNFIKERVID